MTSDEESLLFMCESIKDSGLIAMVLQVFIADNGPLSEEAAKRVREVLKNARPH
jgi:hypothetical protein